MPVETEDPDLSIEPLGFTGAGGPGLSGLTPFEFAREPTHPLPCGPFGVLGKANGLGGGSGLPKDFLCIGMYPLR